MVKSYQYQMESNYDGLLLGVTIMEPDDPPQGLLHIAHGMCEYKERYDDFMMFMCKAGFICVIHDHRGHGESVKSKDDLGYFYDDTGEFIVDDLHQIIASMKTKYAGIPCYLLGHSMGSLVVRTYVKKYDYEIDGLIVCGSPSKNPLAKIAKLLVRIMITFKGDHYRSKLIHNLAFSSYGKKFNEDSKNAWICSDISVVKHYDQDEYCNYQFTLNGFLNLFTLMIKTYNDDNWIMRHKDLPIFFIAGSEDPCIGNKQKFDNAVQFMEQVGYPKPYAKLYKGKRHEILNETGKNEIYEDILKWIISKINM